MHISSTKKVLDIKKCSRCQGTGKIKYRKCDICSGLGKYIEYIYYFIDDKKKIAIDGDTLK